MAGSVQSVEFAGQIWTISVTLPELKMRDGPAAEAFFNRIAGGLERVRVPYWPRMVPQGTLRGFPTVNTSVGRGSLAIPISGEGTLHAGDMLGIGSQLFQVFNYCEDVAGILTVPLVNRVRTNILAGSTVTWYRPTVTCIVPSLSSSASYQLGMMDGMPVDLEEAG